MKKIRILSLVILVIAVFVSLDLLINLLGSLIPTMNDGISTHSIISGNFYFGDGSWSQEKFFNAFLISSLITFLIFVENIVITAVPFNKKQ
ncbi:MAG: hypothetical protein Q4A78_04750 [Peptostreptococcaceae bacterium]|nr:hypothetical protein [Peptostreptococcaceae bacterium]